MTITQRMYYNWLKFELFMLTNFGSCDFGGTQFFNLRIIPKKNVKNQYLLQQYYNAYECWRVGFVFMVFDYRE